MRVESSRFGTLEVQDEDVLHFPHGLLGLEKQRDWVLLSDLETDSLGWLQSQTDPQVAVAVVSPRRFVPGFQLRVSPGELEPLRLQDPKQAQVLALLSKHADELTVNLKAPLVINPELRLGRQVVANGDHPMRYVLPESLESLLKSA